MSVENQAQEPVQDTAPVSVPDTTTQVSGGASFQPQTTDTSASPAAQSLALRDMISQAGLDSSRFTNDQEAAQALISAVGQFRQYRPVIQQGMEFKQLQESEDFRAWMQQRQQSQQQAAPAQQPQAPKWSMPKYDQTWDSLTRWDGQLSRYVVIDPINVSQSVAESRNAYHQAQRDNLNKLLENPIDTIWQAGLEDRINAALQKQAEKFQELFTQYDTVKYNQNYLEQNKQKFYNLDNNGSVLYDTQGNESLTPIGQYALDVAQQYREGLRKQYGVEANALDVQQYVDTQIILAERAGLFGQRQPQAQPIAQQPQQPVETVASQKRRSFVQKATRTSNRNGAQHPGGAMTDETPLNPDVGLREAMHEELRKRGALPQTG